MAILVAVLAPLSLAAQQIGGGTLAVHGYATQGWAATDGVQHYGMTGRGSADFRYAALQARWDRGANTLLVQVNHRRLGDSPITGFEDEVKLNWAFVGHRFGDVVEVKVGRVPVPRGIYNEQRSIGVLLPFYRVPVVFYDEGAYYSETIDGAVASHGFGGDRWGLDVNAYAGQWSLLAYDQSGDTYEVSKVKAERAVGAQLWLNTPVEGLRLGLASQRYRWRQEGDTADNSFLAVQTVQEWHGSLDFTRARGFVRAEAQVQGYEEDDYVATYAQIGVRPATRLLVTGQYDWAQDRNQIYAPDWPRNVDWHRSAGIGASWSFTPQLVAKLEHHWDRGIQVEQPASPLDPPRFRYVIASLSASF